jgi:hypothetical protein
MLHILVALAALLPFGCDGNLLLEPRAAGSLPQTTDVSTPSFSPAPGTYNSDQLVAITSATSDAAIYYTITSDGSVPPEPTTSSIPYSTQIQVSGSPTAVITWKIRAIAVKAGMNDSAVTSGTFIIDSSKVSTPQFTPVAGSYTSDQSVSISCATAGAAVYYTMTTNGNEPTDPTELSTQYIAAIPVAGNGSNVRIKAFATASGMEDSSIASAEFTIAYPGSITVSLNPPSATPIVFSGNSATVHKGTNMTVTTTFTATSYAWYLDFSAVPASTASSYIVATSTLGYGMHTLALVVESGGVLYSGSFNFQVTQ